MDKTPSDVLLGRVVVEARSLAPERYVQFTELQMETARLLAEQLIRRTSPVPLSTLFYVVHSFRRNSGCWARRCENNKLIKSVKNSLRIIYKVAVDARELMQPIILNELTTRYKEITPILKEDFNGSDGLFVDDDADQPWDDLSDRQVVWYQFLWIDIFDSLAYLIKDFNLRNKFISNSRKLFKIVAPSMATNWPILRDTFYSFLSIDAGSFKDDLSIWKFIYLINFIEKNYGEEYLLTKDDCFYEDFEDFMKKLRFELD